MHCLQIQKQSEQQSLLRLLPQTHWYKCYLRVIKHSLKVNFTLREVNFQCTKFHLVPFRQEFCKEYSETGNSSFIGEYSITEAQEWRIGSLSSQAIMVYNSKNDDYYQNFKDPQKRPFLQPLLEANLYHKHIIFKILPCI